LKRITSKDLMLSGLTKGKPLKKVFGVAIDKHSKDIPLVLRSCITYLDKPEILAMEGIFRHSGKHSMIQEMKERYDRGEVVDLSTINDPNTVAGILKQYLRELPEPLCSFEFYDMFIAAVGIPDLPVRKYQVLRILEMLPYAYQIVLKYLVGFLCRIAALSDQNRMTPPNLATVFAPNLIRSKGREISTLVEDTPASHELTQMLIIHFDDLLSGFPDPPAPTENPSTGKETKSVPTSTTTTTTPPKPTGQGQEEQEPQEAPPPTSPRSGEKPATHKPLPRPVKTGTKPLPKTPGVVSKET